jgi:NAD(P)-dependent dehydrogenase (short-subunit alcohol dehydrogenase family)
MKIVISGASGLIGTQLVTTLKSSGHEVVQLVRRTAGAGQIMWDPKSGKLDSASLEGCDAVIPTFYPVEIYPGALRWIVELSPLTRGTHLVRSLCFGDLNWLMLVDIAYLSAISFIGYRHAVRRLGVLLLK